MKELRFLLLVIAICLASGVKAQFYNTEDLFYVVEPVNLNNPQVTVHLVRFSSGIGYIIRTDLKDLCDNMSDYENNIVNRGNKWLYSKNNYAGQFNYSDKLSNEKWTVYSVEGSNWVDNMTGEFHQGYSHFVAFKKDFSQYIEWTEPEGHEYGDIKKYFKRISKSELKKIKFTGAREFLQ